jgi:hypothetical protein
VCVPPVLPWLYPAAQMPVDPSRPPDPNPAFRYRCSDVVVFAFGDGRDLVYSKANRESVMLPSASARLLTQCRQYRTLAQHAAESGNEEADETLSDLVNRGLLICESDLETALLSATDSGGEITTIGFVTCDRTAALERAVVSHMEHTARFNRQTGFAVIDDSKDPSVAQANRAMLKRVSGERKIQIDYAGLEDRAIFAEALSRESGVPLEVVRFGLYGHPHLPTTIGAARNALLLHTAGELMLNPDDDVICELGRNPESQPGLALSSVQDPTEFWFYPDRETTLRSVERVDTDYLAVHERLLGPIAGSLQRYRNDGLQLDRMSTSFERRLRQRGGRVAVTSSGYFGDSGVGATAYLFLEANSHGRLIRSEEDYRCYVQSRQVLRSSPRATINDGSFCMSGSMGIDNREIVPPFFPVGRNSDGILGVTLRLCFPDAYIGFVPVPVHHAPESPRRQTFERIWERHSTVTLSHIVVRLLQLFKADPGPDSLLYRLGLHMKSFGRLSFEDFSELLRLTSWRSFAQQQLHVERSLADRDSCPEFFAKYVRKYLETLRAALPKEDYIAPQELRKRYDAAQSIRATQELVALFGELLCHWEPIVLAARRLRTQGVRLGHPI